MPTHTDALASIRFVAERIATTYPNFAEALWAASDAIETGTPMPRHLPDGRQRTINHDEARQLRERRHSLGWSLKAVAEAVGRSVVEVSAAERGKGERATYEKVRDYLARPAADLIRQADLNPQENIHDTQ